MNKKEILRKVNIALDMFYENNADLVSLKVNEKAISHKFACYLQELFKKYEVDCEYDKHGKYKKTLYGISECSKRHKTDSILPDIVVHKRVTDRFNLIVFEIKSKGDASPCDIKKLELMTAQTGEFKYEWGVFIKFEKTHKGCRIDLYAKGRKIEY